MEKVIYETKRESPGRGAKDLAVLNYHTRRPLEVKRSLVRRDIPSSNSWSRVKSYYVQNMQRILAVLKAGAHPEL